MAAGYQSGLTTEPCVSALTVGRGICITPAVAAASVQVRHSPAERREITGDRQKKESCTQRRMKGGEETSTEQEHAFLKKGSAVIVVNEKHFASGAAHTSNHTAWRGHCFDEGLKAETSDCCSHIVPGFAKQLLMKMITVFAFHHLFTNNASFLRDL